jgi:hypothetical protein
MAKRNGKETIIAQKKESLTSPMEHHHAVVVNSDLVTL